MGPAKPLIVGQAPSRVGDGTPFSGPSGERLCRLVGVKTLEELRRTFDLKNLNPHPIPKRDRRRGDQFDHKLAIDTANRILRSRDTWDGDIVCCGRLVWRSFFPGQRPPDHWLSSYETLVNHTERETTLVVLHYFPHPSGLNRWWNDVGNVLEAAALLKRVGWPSG
jgi:uracil-DNA glycosylase